MTASKQDRAPAAPPRLLLGVSLLLWGGICGHPLISLMAAVVIEAAHWTRVRWDFGEIASQRAWKASLILVIFAGAIVWMNSSVFAALPRTIVWLPIALLPLQFVQSYGINRSLSLTSFSHFLRRRKMHSEQYGLPYRDIRFNFGYVFFVTILIASSLGEHARSPIFFPAVLILLFWAFYRCFSWKHRLAPIGAIVVIAIATAGGLGGEMLLSYAYQRFVLGNMEYGSLNWARQTRTAIGDLGEIKQSPGIQWRLIPGQGDLPRLIRVAAYNAYANTYWSTVLPPDEDLANPLKVTGMFEELPSLGADEVDYRVTARADDPDTFMDGSGSYNPALPYFTLRGSFPRKGLLPIPANSASVVQDSQLLEISPFGTLRLDPKHPVTNAVIRSGDPITTALPPWPDPRNPNRPDPDLRIPENEQEAVAQFVDGLGIRDLPLAEKVQTLKQHFNEHFTYTRYLENPRPGSDNGRAAFITLFLNTTKRGHCEYFATATAFILRECGIPTRYATGFSVVETDASGNALLRGTHAHAWTLAWDEVREKWIDIDLTPPDWTGMETPRKSALQPLIDRLQILRDDILVWRTQPGNLAIAILIMVVPLFLGALLSGRRLWKSRRRLEEQLAHSKIRSAPETTALSDLESLATPHIGPRSPATPLTRWLIQLAPILSDRTPLEEAIRLHQERRFDPAARPVELDSRIKAAVSALHEELSSLATPASS